MDRNTVGRIPSSNEHTSFWCLRWNSKSLSQWRVFPGGTNGKEPTSECRRDKRHEFDPWVGKIPWRRKWQPTPVFLPGKSYGQRSLVGYNPWGHKRVGHDWATKQLSSTDFFPLGVKLREEGWWGKLCMKMPQSEDLLPKYKSHYMKGEWLFRGIKKLSFLLSEW